MSASVPRCDDCGQPTIGTAFCGVCANEREALADERYEEWYS